MIDIIPERHPGGATLFVRATLVLSVALLTAPWLISRSGGPSPAVEPWLYSAFLGSAFAVLGPSAYLRAPIVGLIGLLAAWSCLVSGLSMETVALVASCVLVVLVACSVAGRAHSPDTVNAIAWSWLLAGVISTAIALTQYFGASAVLQPLGSAAPVGEAFANLRQRNQFATLTVISTAAAVWLAAHQRLRAVAVIAITWLAIGNAATTSRTGLLGLFVLSVLFTFAGRRDRWFRLCVLALASYAVAALLLPYLLEWATGQTGNSLWRRVADVASCSSRRVLWSNVLELIAARPWFGWGWGELDYAHYTHFYRSTRFCDILDNAHNLPLQLAVELGIPAALVLCLTGLWMVWLARPWAETHPARRLAWGVLAVLALHSLLEYPLWYGPFQIALGLSLGLVCSHRVAMRAGRVSQLLLPGVLLAGVTYAAWDYHRVSQIYLPIEERSPAYASDTLAQARRSWLFANQARFAELTLAPLSPANATWVWDNAQRVLHYSPEPRVIEKVVESATMLGYEAEAVMHLARFRAAFPEDYAAWVQRNSDSTQRAR